MNDMNWLAIYPEILLLAMGCVVALVDLWVTDEQRRPTYWLTQLTLAIVAGLHFSYFDAGLTTYAMQGMVVADPMGHLLAGFACIATLVTLVYARPYAGVREMLKGELFILSLFALLGINVMLSANNFLVVYLGLELMSLSLYALVALRRDNAIATEAAMKYFVLGALASGFLLYGLSMMYGATGSLSIPQVFDVISQGVPNASVLVFGVVFVVAGLAFKLGAAPFHMWVPDVYQGAPTAITLFIGSVPKIAAFGFAYRLLDAGLAPTAEQWGQMLAWLALLSLVIGNLIALAQTNLKRMLAYSTISHMGFVLLGMLSGVVANKADGAVNAYSSSMFYSITYMLTTLGTFGLILVRTRKGFEAETLDDLKGMSRRHPWFAFLMLVMMFSMAGIPPTVGFYAKLSVLQAVVSAGMSWLAVVAVVFSLIGAFYYLRIVKLMYFDAPVGEEPLEASTGLRSVLSLNGLAVILLGLFPAGLMDLCFQAIRATLAS